VKIDFLTPDVRYLCTSTDVFGLAKTMTYSLTYRYVVSGQQRRWKLKFVDWIRRYSDPILMTALDQEQIIVQIQTYNCDIQKQRRQISAKIHGSNTFRENQSFNLINDG
jgi:hypothetical protein